MKGFWNYFWIIYILFFAIPFPMLLYYNTDYGVMDSDGGTNPWLALVYLATSLILWMVLMKDWFRKWVLLPFKMRNNIRRLLKEGVKKSARILKSKVLKPGRNGTVTTEITFSLRNFSGTEITEQSVVNDTKPALRRYDEGKTIQLMIDDKLKTTPYLTLDEVQVGIKKGRIIMLCFIWLMVTAAVLWYYGYSYLLENSGRGWRFLKCYHPLVLVPLILILTRFGLMKLLKFVGGSSTEILQLKYYGLRTDAQIVSAAQTGIYINEQPQVKFELRYQDDAGSSHTVSLKKIIPLIDLGMAKQGSIPIFYLKTKPDQVAFASDLER